MRSRGISIVEVVIAVFILGIVAALTLPRLGQAAGQPADERVRVRVDLQVLRVAIERYYQDHRVYPGYQTDGRNPAGSAAAFVAQLTECTDEAGRVADPWRAGERNGMVASAFRFGPYLRDGVPACPVRPRSGCRGVHVISGTAMPGFVAEAREAGWVYNCDTGQIACNSDGRDIAGRGWVGY